MGGAARKPEMIARGNCQVVSQARLGYPGLTVQAGTPMTVRKQGYPENGLGLVSDTTDYKGRASNCIRALLSICRASGSRR